MSCSQGCTGLPGDRNAAAPLGRPQAQSTPEDEIGGPCPPGRDQRADQTYVAPQRGEQPSRAAPPRRDQTYTVPPRADQTYRVQQPMNETYPTRRPQNVTYNMPPRVDRTYRAERPMNETYDIRRPQNETYTIHRPRNETYTVPPRVNQTYTVQGPNETYIVDSTMAESTMDDLGDGGEWSLSAAVSIDDLQNDQPEEEEDDEACPPCGPEGGPSGYYADVDTNANASDPSCPPECTGDEGEGNNLSYSDALAISREPSNISVFDAEELNRTTAPRNSDLDIPRSRIWVSLNHTLHETEDHEDEEFASFIQGIHRQRRRWIDNTRLEFP